MIDAEEADPASALAAAQGGEDSGGRSEETVGTSDATMAVTGSAEHATKRDSIANDEEDWRCFLTE
eukprot:793718-Alexandrium_andersonii.AAC.1